jgi:predicted transcriptional regulator
MGYASPQALAAHTPDVMFTSMDDIVRFLSKRRGAR